MVRFEPFFFGVQIGTILKTFWFCLGFGGGTAQESEADAGPCHCGGGKEL